MRYLILLLLTARVFAVDYTQDANCLGAWYIGPLGGAPCSWEFDRSASTPDTLKITGSQSNTMVRRYSSLDSSIYCPTGYTGASRHFTTNYFHTLANATDLNINGANAEIAIGGWIKVMSAPASAAVTIWCGKYMTTSNNRQYRMSVTGTGSGQVKFDFTLSSDGTAVTTLSTTATTYNDSTWYHVYGVSDDDSMYIYVNGARSNAVAYTAGIASKGGYFTVGSQHLGVGSQTSTYIDEVGLFNRALSAAEVNDIYTNGLMGNAGVGDFPLYTEYLATTGVIPADADFYTFVDDSIRDICTAYGLTYRNFGTTSGGRNIGGVVISPPGFGRTVMVVSALHGDNGGGTENHVSWIGLHYLKYIAAHQPYQVRVVIIPLVNPDGVVAETRTNGNQVNINRNFDIKRSAIPAYTIGHSEYPGASAFSEVETRAVRDAVLAYDPDLLVDLHGVVNLHYYVDTDSVGRESVTQISNGHEPFVQTSGAYADSGGYGFNWADSVGVPLSWAYETGSLGTVPDMKEELNRFIGFMNYHTAWLDSLGTIPQDGLPASWQGSYQNAINSRFRNSWHF